MIQAVMVVPMCAPIITEMACTSVSSPALTNDTVMRVVAVELCTAAVTNIPVSMPVKRFVVIAPKTWRSCEPAIFCKLSLIDFMPNISRANEPTSLSIISMSIIIAYIFVSSLICATGVAWASATVRRICLCRHFYACLFELQRYE